jgi:hypothetical protein
VSGLEILVPLVLGAVINEVIDVCPWLARKLVRWSAQRITDASMAERYEEEWLAGLEDRPGKLLQLISAISIVIGASWRMRDLFRTADTGVGVRGRRRRPRLHMRLALPDSLSGLGSYWGYATSVLSPAVWVTEGDSWAWALVLAGVSVLYFAFQVPTYCGAATRDGSGCRNNARGLLLGCRIHHHRWARLRRTGRTAR